MYSWKTIRVLSAILLLIPIVHLALLVSREALAALDSSPNVWDSQLDAYTKADRLVERPQDPVVVIGGRRVKLWKGLEGLLAPKPVLMRGLGDAIVDDLNFHYERLVGFYQPQTVVLFPGNSEFHIRDMKSADGLVHAIQEFAQKDLFHRSTGRFYIITPLNTQIFPGDRTKIEKTTALLKTWAKSEDRIKILDANVLLRDAKGIAKADYFRADGVNLNDLGYTRLSMLLLSQLERDNPSIQGAL
jgi:hypothetical protein